jgi:hypothetical protein
MTALAEAILEHHQPESALNWLEQAEERAMQNSEHFFDAEIYRVRAEVIAMMGETKSQNAESLLWRAIEAARRQNLKSLNPH